MGDSSGPSTALSVGIVGAGIAGLASATAPRRAGHDVEVSLPYASRWIEHAPRIGDHTETIRSAIGTVPCQS
jgi:monoamine oxidase